MYSLLCVFISQYSNKVAFILMGEAEMRGTKGGESQTEEVRVPLLPLEPPLPVNHSK